MIKTRYKRLTCLKIITKEGMTMSESKKARKSCMEVDMERHLISDHQYIFMKGYIYSGLKKKTIPYKDLSEQELLEIWCGDWVDNVERSKTLTHFGTRILYEKARKAFEKDLLSR